MALPQLPPPDAPVLHIHSHTAGQVGPISRLDLLTKLADGTIPAQCHVWMDGMAGWEALDEHKETLLAGLDPSSGAPSPGPSATSAASLAAGGASPEAVERAAATADAAVSATSEAEGAGASAVAATEATNTVVAAAEPRPAAEASPAPSEVSPAQADEAEVTPVAAEPTPSPAPEPATAQPEHSAPSQVAEPESPAPGPSPPVAGESDDDYQDRMFGQLVRQSWAYLGEHRFAAHIDEIFVGAVITATLDTGYSLIDLTSDGTHHYLRFENLSDRARIIVRLTHLTGSLAVSKVLGQRMSAVIGYGERVSNIGKIWSALQAEMKSSYIQDAEPGTITVDGDMASGYVYCQVDLYLDIDDYVSRDYSIDYPRLSTHVGSVTHALRKYLRGRFA
jgi:hypothetical protein